MGSKRSVDYRWWTLPRTKKFRHGPRETRPVITKETQKRRYRYGECWRLWQSGRCRVTDVLMTGDETLRVVEAARKMKEDLPMQEMMIQCADTAAVRMVAAMVEESRKERRLIGQSYEGIGGQPQR